MIPVSTTIIILSLVCGVMLPYTSGLGLEDYQEFSLILLNPFIFIMVLLVAFSLGLLETMFIHPIVKNYYEVKN